MRFGISTMRHRRVVGRGRSLAAEIVVEARAAAKAGFDCFVVEEATGPAAASYLPADVLTSWIAATTLGLRVRSVVTSARRVDVDDARRWASIDALSGGRLDLAVADVAVLADLGRAWTELDLRLLPAQSPHPPLAFLGDHVLAGRHRLALLGVLTDHDPGRIDEVVDGYRQAWDSGRPLTGVSPSGDVTLSIPPPSDRTALRDLVRGAVVQGVAEVVMRLDEGQHEELTARIRQLGTELPALHAESARLHPAARGREAAPAVLHARGVR